MSDEPFPLRCNYLQKSQANSYIKKNMPTRKTHLHGNYIVFSLPKWKVLTDEPITLRCISFPKWQAKAYVREDNHANQEKSAPRKTRNNSVWKHSNQRRATSRGTAKTMFWPLELPTCVPLARRLCSVPRRLSSPPQAVA